MRQLIKVCFNGCVPFYLKQNIFFIVSGLMVIFSFGGIFSVLRALARKVLWLLALSIAIVSVASIERLSQAVQLYSF